MGTNYYVLQQRCKECGQKPQDIHLGKSSAGWQFTFQYNGGEYYKNVKEMRKWLKDKVIANEYGELVPYKTFWNMVVSKQKSAKLNHAKMMQKQFPSHEGEYVICGYSFSDGEFS